jgi:hypothetical protein
MSFHWVHLGLLLETSTLSRGLLEVDHFLRSKRDPMFKKLVSGGQNEQSCSSMFFEFGKLA